MDDPETPGAGPAGGDEPSVSLADAAVASAIARAASEGRAADRAPTLEQLLAAFGESEATAPVRARIAAALRLAGVEVEPPLETAAPGQRLALSVDGGNAAGGRNRSLTAAYAVLALAVIFGTAFAVSRFLSDDGERVSEVLTDTTFTIGTATTTPTTGTATATTTTDSTTTATTATTATTTTTAAETTPTETTTTTAKPKPRPKPVSRLVTVRADATDRPTFLCVEDGNGKQLFNGTLSGREVFRARRVRMNIGLATTRVTVNGKPLEISGSPSGFDITRTSVKPLPLGQRPCG